MSFFDEMRFCVELTCFKEGTLHKKNTLSNTKINCHDDFKIFLRKKHLKFEICSYSDNRRRLNFHRFLN